MLAHDAITSSNLSPSGPNFAPSDKARQASMKFAPNLRSVGDSIPQSGLSIVSIADRARANGTEDETTETTSSQQDAAAL